MTGGKIDGKFKCVRKTCNSENFVKFAVPTIAMTVFMSFYTMVDGLFVSNLIGTDALSAINLTAPVIQLVTAVSTMEVILSVWMVRRKKKQALVEQMRAIE